MWLNELKARRKGPCEGHEHVNLMCNRSGVDAWLTGNFFVEEQGSLLVLILRSEGAVSVERMSLRLGTQMHNLIQAKTTL